MGFVVSNQVSFLRTTRNFPLDDVKQLGVEVDRSYVDIANAVNSRTIGIFPVNTPILTGESWFIDRNKRQQSFRKVYVFTSTADIDIGFKISSISQFSRFDGIYTDGTSWYGLIPGTSVAIPGQILFYVTVNVASTTSDVIKFVVGAGAPALTSGKIVLEWLSEP